ncbi:MAG: ABC transporter permease, partial [Planctomycetes bacterium]|nr:ABC transporter permease [Planctomycetota bacterium]
MASLLVNILALALPLTLMQVYDRILANRSTGTLAWLVVGCLAALLLETLLRLARARISNWLGASFEHEVGCRTMKTLLSCRLESFERHGAGEHMDRLGAVSRLRGFYSGQVFQVLMDLPFALLYLFAVWHLGGWLVLFPLALIAVFCALVGHYSLGALRVSRRRMEVNESRYGFVVELLTGIHTVKGLTLEEQMLRRYEGLQRRTAEADMEISRWQNLPGITGAAFSQISMFGIIILGGGLVRDGVLSLGGLTACMMMAGRAMQPIQQLAAMWMRLSDA